VKIGLVDVEIGLTEIVKKELQHNISPPSAALLFTQPGWAGLIMDSEFEIRTRCAVCCLCNLYMMTK